jgi:predicted ATPase
MKIKQLHIEGFRSLRKVSWFPGDLNVIIGPNGTDHSNPYTGPPVEKVHCDI